MFNFAYAYVFLLLPLPWLCRWLLPTAQNKMSQTAIRLPFYHAIAQHSQQTASSTINKWRWLLITLIWLLLLCALARPQTLGEPISQDRAGRNIMLAIDISESMAVKDLTWLNHEASRIQVVKALASNFIEKREGDRLGLILFGSRAYLQTALTFDRTTVKKQLQDASIGLAGVQTAIGDALALGVKHLKSAPENQRILVLLTDGVSNVGIAPQDALAAAVKEKVKIYPIAFGHDHFTVQTMLGPRTIRMPLDETLLKEMAAATGGQYFRAEDSQALKQVYETLNKMETTQFDEQVYRPLNEWYPYPAGLCLLLCCLLGLNRQLTYWRSTSPLAAGRR